MFLYLASLKVDVDEFLHSLGIDPHPAKPPEGRGGSLQWLLRDIRERLAKKYLCEDYSVEQITYLLGFSEPSVFRKAFKKWSGVTPREYRENAFAGG